MSNINWTEPQRNAIDSRGDILVSAAAGSGKTAVLVQRVMELIEKECNIDELLIVTFTRAAAAQMKEKISKAISDRIIAEPDNKHFRLQQILLEKAKITTIDSFCADVLKNNFQHLDSIDISMNYKNLDAAQFNVLLREVLDDVLEQYYNSESKSFLNLMDVFTTGKDDLNIYNIIQTLHNYTSAFVDRKGWISKAINAYKSESITKSPWADVVFETLKEYFSLMSDYYERGIEITSEDEKTGEVYGAFLKEEKSFVQTGLEAVQNRDWAVLWELKSYSFGRFPAVKKDIDPILKEKAKNYREAAKKIFVKKITSLIIESEEDFLRDNELIYPVAKELGVVFESFEKALFEKKLERQEFEFSDISYLALKILVDDELKPTLVAEEYKKNFKAILVDEYQDTNGVQDLIFETISNNNLFVVGDVKQSIYRFRLAMPEIFIGRRKALKPYAKGEKNGYILLKNNFRSKKTVTDFVNFLFKNLMSETLGDIDYNEDEYLIPGAEKEDEEAPSPEIHILDNPNASEQLYKNHEYEARYIAKLIKTQVENGEEIKLGDEKKKVEYGDYCILLRSKTHMHDLEKVFEETGVPYTSQGGDNLFDASEIILVMSFLRAIDNPLRDVDLIAVMYSEIFGFSAEELASIRILKRKGSFYPAVNEAALKGNEKCREFIAELEQYRTAAATNEPSEFLRLFYSSTSLPDIVGAGENGAVKRANLLKFISVVQMYSDAGYYGLTGLVRFLEKVKSGNTDITTAFVPGGESRVKIMSVHASKGLEFPIVIFAFSNNSNTHNPSNIVLNRELGIGMKPKTAEDNIRYDTFSFSAVNLANVRAETSEELRTLYVALTRAKTKLIITGTFDSRKRSEGSSKRTQAIREISSLIGEIDRIDEGWLRLNNNFLYWIIACALRHPKAKELRALCDNEQLFIDSSEGGELKVFLPRFIPEKSEKKETVFTSLSDRKTEEKIKQNFAFSYKFSGSEKIESKKTPSALAESESGADYSFEKPSFMLESKLSAAARGTATHRFMEKIRSFSCDVNEETEYMLSKGFLSEAEAKAIDKSAIKKFLESPLAKRMSESEKLYKEYSVSYLEDASFFDESIPENLKNEKIFVDGMIDAVFIENGEAVIVDYKTDRVKDIEELRDRYQKQMLLYKRAVEAVWGISVKECCIYSFALGKELTIDF